MLNNIDVKLHSEALAHGPDVNLHQVTRTLAERWKEAREDAGLGVNALDRAIGQSSGYTSRIEKGEKLEPAVGIVANAARVLGVRLAWLVDEEGPKLRSAEGEDPHVGTFVMKLRRLPGLEEWVEANPTKLTISQLAKGMSIYDEVKPASRSDGQPLNGWGGFFEDALSGRLTRALPASQSEAEALELGQMSASGRKRVRSASKKR
jgi:transcriptional regulator with XRE-family HTH domain